MSQSCPDPLFLVVGTLISGKFRGAFCEAVVKKVDKKIRVSVRRDSPATGVKIIEDKHIPSVQLTIGTRVDVVVDGERVKGTINSLKDNSLYHVVFTDGDKTTLRRTQLIIMGPRHYTSDGNLDAMPLTNPEHFSAPVVRRSGGGGGAGPSQKTKSKPAESESDDEEEEEEEDDRNQPSTSTSKTVPSRRSKEPSKSEKVQEKGPKIWTMETLWDCALEYAQNNQALAQNMLVGFNNRRGYSRLRRRIWRRVLGQRKPWWFASTRYLLSCTATFEILQDKQTYQFVRRWLKSMKNEKKEFRFAVYYPDPRNTETAQEFAEEWISEGLAEDEMPTAPIHRRSIEFDHQPGKPFYQHFIEAEWHPAVLLPNVYTINGRRKRDIESMMDGTVRRVNEDQVVPFEWVPKFARRDLDYIIDRQPEEQQEAFRTAYNFVIKYLRKELDHTTLRIMLKFAQPLQKKQDEDEEGKLKVHWDLKKWRAHLAEKREKKLEEAEEKSSDEESSSSSSEDDDESDSSILNAPTEAKDRFLATLMQSHDTNNTMLNSNPQIQGHDVDLFYLYNLALRIGAPRKVYSAKPWKRWARKLVPEADNAGPELEAMFKSCLETFMNINAKLSFPMEQMMVTSERRVVLPGQYSENRRRRETALGQQDTPRPSTSSRGRGGAKTGRGGGRKRKDGSLDSNNERKRARQEDSSRATTSSPGPSEAPSEQRDDDDGGSITASEDSGRKKQTPRGPTGSVKKGRPRKTPQEVRIPRPGGRNADRAMPVDPNDPEYCRANVLSDIPKTSKIRASYQDQWFNGTALEVMHDYSHDLLNQLLYLQDALRTNRENTSREEAFREIHRMWQQMSARTHYSGWNSRYDEFLTFDKLMVTKKDQYRARRRFRKLPGGEILRPETIAIVEARFCTERDAVVKPDYQELAREAFATDEYDEQELLNIQNIIRRRSGKSPDRPARPHRRQLDSSSSSDSEEDEQEEEEEEHLARRRRQESEDEDEMDDEPPRRRAPEDDDNSPELGEKSTSPSPSARNSREHSPESEESSGLQREEREERDRSRDVSMEIGEPRSRSEEEEEPKEESKEESEGAEPRPVLSDSDADEPRYPSMQRSPVAEEAENPSGSSGLVEEEDATQPIHSPPQPSTPPASSSTPMFPPNPLQSSGPLTLDSVHPTSGPLEKFDDAPSTSSTSSHDNRARSNTMTTSAEERPGGKRQRRASERSGIDDESGIAAKRNLLQQQFSSGALTLESSGPIVPMPVVKGARRNTASPQISNSGPLTASGPLTLAPPGSSEPVLVANAPPMPPPKPQIGRPRKSATPAASTSVIDAREDHDEPGPSEPGPSTSADSRSETLRAPEDVVREELTPPEPEPIEQVTPRGSASQRGGPRRKRGRGGFAAQRTPKGTAAARRAPEYIDDEEERAAGASTPQATPSTRGEGFIAQKNRMAAEMEAEGTSRNYHELGLEDIDVLLAASPMDENLVLEEKTAELREQYMQAKYELSLLEKRWKRENEAARKKSEEEAKKARAVAAAEKSSESPESDESPPRPSAAEAGAV